MEDYTALAAAGMNMAGQIGNAVIAAKNSEKSLRLTKDLYQYQNELNRENWAIANEYNLPSNQMQRLAEAGLNPNLVYGTGNIQNVAGQVSSPHGQQFQVMAPRVDLDFLQVARLMSDIKLQNSQAQKNYSESKLIESQTTGQDLTNQFNQETLTIRELLVDQQYSSVAKQMEKWDQEIVDGRALTNSQIQLNAQNVDTLIQGRFVQWKELQLTEEQIGASIKQGWARVKAEIMTAGAAQTSAAANYIRATADVSRIEKLNELGTFQIGRAALSFQAEYDSFKHRQELATKTRENQILYENALNQFYQKTGIPFDVLKSVIPLAPSVSTTIPDLSSGGTTTFSF